MLKLGDRIVIVNDRFEQNLPVGEYGYIIAYDRNNDSVFDYIVRVPKANRQYYVSSDDVELEEVLLAQEADRIEREALIDFALATRNEELFRRIMNGDSPAEPESDKEVLSREEFIKQINLKAWI
ncbi:ATPase [Cohnella lubricantis]|uniref:ATPase n=1 Tax=Cohnella lubricantis TaxID=2163172 RepID=A0A841TCP6_9BACL|nr:ATPase [Cohnella lubricantis]MBB6677946.1 ATPase [Cohnella lubricantis]MBP2119986.1 signal peptidase I [Cohnella lubricantis]